MILREERAGEEAAIAAVIEAAFREAVHSDGTEHALPAKLREAGDLTMSLVAEEADELIGHVAFSPVMISDGTAGWYGMAPVSVIPSRQRAGVGSALICEGLEQLRKRGANGCVVLGNPAYYGRFGFVHDPRLAFPGPPPEHFQRLVLKGAAPSGTITYAPAFY